MMESIKLKKGEVHLMEDRIVIEGDGAVNRKRINIITYTLLFILILVYSVSSYEKYANDPHQFEWFLFFVRIFLLGMLFIPSVINNVFRFSTVEEIPYISIKKHEPAGSLFSRGKVTDLYLTNNNIRKLIFEKDEMTKFKDILDQKMAKGLS